MTQQQYNFGMIGLGTMGSNLVLNMTDHGFSVAGYDKDSLKVTALNELAEGRKLQAFDNMPDFIASLSVPRVILLLVPAGPIVDAVIFEMKPMLSPADVIIDCGNSHFADTQLRIETLSREELHFMGIGISGGETGARFGPSLMPGGDKEAYARIAPMLEAIAAKVGGVPCTAYMGAGAAGHYVKMVHNGIEYAMMQLIAESYHLFKTYAGLDNQDIHDIYAKWNNGKLQSFLIATTAAVFLQKDEDGKGWLIDRILDTAHQKGTGAWMSQDAMKIQAPINAIDAAVSQRILSSLKKERVLAASMVKRIPLQPFNGNLAAFIDSLEDALFAGFLISFAQGLAMLQLASHTYKFGLNITTIAGIWRGGCIIRAAMLEDIMQAFTKEPELTNLLLAKNYTSDIERSQVALRNIVQAGLLSAIPLPCLSAALHYYDSYHSDWLPANLVQAQRDFFGAHGYERNDREGNFHTIWNETIH